MTYSGGCQCNDIRFKFSTDPIVAYTCHCTECQKQSQSAFGISVWFPRNDFQLFSGETAFWKTKADSGNDKLCAYCPRCGCRIYHANSEESDILSVKGGALDDIRNIKPVAHIWIRSALDWSISKLDNLPCYETEPNSFAELIRLFKSGV